MWFFLYLKKLCEDSLFRGVFCGVTAGILKNVIDYILYTFEAKEHVFWHFASILSFHNPPKGLLMHSFSLLLELIFNGFLGYIFVLLAQKIKTRHYALLGIFYGSLIWFSIKGIIVAYEVNELKSQTNIHPVLTWLLSVAFGLIVALLERKLSPKTS